MTVIEKSARREVARKRLSLSARLGVDYPERTADLHELAGDNRAQEMMDRRMLKPIFASDKS